MWNTILLNIIISIAIISITHHIWEHLKTNYSTQKTKNLAEIHAAKYKTILNDLSSTTQDTALVPVCVVRPNEQFISVEEQAWMKQELDSFIQSL